MRGFDRDEIIEAFRGFDACSERHDWDAAAEYFTEDSRGGNVRLGVLDVRHGDGGRRGAGTRRGPGAPAGSGAVRCRWALEKVYGVYDDALR